MSNYYVITDLGDLQDYLSGAAHVSFDFETAPDEQWRHDPKAALDANKAHIVGISFSVAEGSAVYVPIAHRAGRNLADIVPLWRWLAGWFADPAVTLSYVGISVLNSSGTRVFRPLSAKVRKV